MCPLNIDRALIRFAGAVALIGTLLGAFVNPLWLILPGFVGANMVQASFTGFCPLAKILKKLGVKEGAAF